MNAAISVIRAGAAWLLLLVALGFALLFLNGAAFSAWMSGGSPNPFPQGWAMRSQAQLAYAGAVAFAGFAVFRVIREIPALSRITIALAVVSAVLGVWPSVHQFVQVDRCLDSGGRWNYEGMQCER